jgi:hypothetical protein
MAVADPSFLSAFCRVNWMEHRANLKRNTTTGVCLTHHVASGRVVLLHFLNIFIDARLS